MEDDDRSRVQDTTGNGMWVVRLSDLESKYPEVRR